MTKQVQRSNKRHSFRVPVCGVATLRWAGHQPMRYPIDDVSLGGAALRGAPAPRPDCVVHAELAMAQAASIHASGRVVRTMRGTKGRPGFAVAFDRVSADAEDVIHDLSLSLLERATRYRVLLVAAPHPRRAAAVALIASTGWEVMTAGTPLEAIVALQNDDVDIRWLVIISSLLDIPETELLRFAAEEHPHVRRMLVTRDHDTLTAMRSLRAGIADACLVQPLRRSGVRRAIGDGPQHWCG